MYAGMKGLTAYFGEDWDAGDPSRVLRIVRDFMNLFDKAHREIEVCPCLPMPSMQSVLLLCRVHYALYSAASSTHHITCL